MEADLKLLPQEHARVVILPEPLQADAPNNGSVQQADAVARDHADVPALLGPRVGRGRHGRAVVVGMARGAHVSIHALQILSRKMK